jgi:hypothetical protein
MSRCVSLRRFRDPALPFPSLVPAGDGSPASQVLSERSDFPPSVPPHSLSFAGRYRGLLLVARQRGVAVAGSSSVQMPVPQSSAFDSHSWRLRDLPGSSAILANMPCSSTPADLVHQAIAMHQMLPSTRLTASAPHSVTFRGSMTQPARSLSTLRGSDYSDGHHARLASHWRANLGGAGLSPAGLLKEVSTLCFNSHRFPLLVAFLAHQPP